MLLPAKLANFLSVAKQLTPFLTKFQTDKPMLPFLCSDLANLVRALMSRFIKSAILSEAKTISKLIAIDVTKRENHVDYSKLDLGFSTEQILKNLVTGKKLSDRQAMEFRMEAKSFLVVVVKKILEKSPLSFTLSRNMVLLDPRNMIPDKLEENKPKLKVLLRVLIEAKRLTNDDADVVLRQYEQFVLDIVSQSAGEFKNFDPVTSRCDTLFYNSMNTSATYDKLWSCVKMLLLMSHGQATIERGFSINKEVEEYNMKEETFASIRIICDHVNFVGGIHNIDVSNKQLLISCSSARSKYSMYLETQQKLKEQQAVGQKRKVITDEIENLKMKKKCLNNDIESLTQSADKLAEQAEKMHAITMITQSNSLRRTAKEKSAELQTVNEQLEAAQNKLSNC